MRILFDQGTPAPLRQHLDNHSVDTAFERGWSNLRNGDLLDHAEKDGYELLITTDQNLRFQQRLAGRRIGIVVLLTTSWPRIRLNLDRVIAEINLVNAGEYLEVGI